MNITLASVDHDRVYAVEGEDPDELLDRLFLLLGHDSAFGCRGATAWLEHLYGASSAARARWLWRGPLALLTDGGTSCTND